jgi:SAM-dependent methyltransferase
MKKNSRDAFGKWLENLYDGGKEYAVIERSDGYITPEQNDYFSTPDKWPDYGRKALALVRGRVLDVGCGAGRVALYLQEKGFKVTGLDNSPGAIAVCKKRGVKRTLLMGLGDAGKLRPDNFDTVVMTGGNFGLLETPLRAKKHLKNLYRITSPQGRIIAEAMDPYKTKNPDHLRYLRMNRAEGKYPGQMRIRVRFRGMATPWFNYLFVSRKEMQAILSGTGWEIDKIIPSGGGQYMSVLKK